jgi:hypothetical protein
MAPTFALDLSLDGIRLLYRADGGWTVVGDVALDDPALPARLAALRAEAERLAPGAAPTELVIPPSQIRYATVPRPASAPLTEADLLPAVAGLTPLSPEELVFDWEVRDDAVHLALVDRTTLDEAESFAEAYGFDAVSFGARPTAAQFPREVDFGPTARAGRLPAPPAPPAIAPTEPPAASAPPAPDPVGAEALARSLSAPRPVPAAGPASRPRLPARPMLPRVALPPARRLALAAGGAAAAVVALALVLGTGGSRDPSASLPDTPPDVALALPALGTPDLADAAPASPAAPADAGPVAVAAAPVEAPAPGATPTADLAAPPALADEAQAVLAPASLPAAPPLPQGGTSEDIYLASIDPVTRASDAVALLPPGFFPASLRPSAPLPPAPAGTTFDFAADGLVVATPDGALTPDGVIVRLGRPPLAPPAAPARAADIALEPTEVAIALPDRKPRARPSDLVERNERATFGGRTRAEFAALRPAPRPASPQAEALAEAPAAPTEQAIAASLVPRDRPADLATRVATASAVAAALSAPAPEPAAPAPQVAAAAPPAAEAPRTQSEDYDDGEPETASAAPRIPTSASVARQATIENAIRLRDLNLIGVYGTERDRRALVRMPNGRYVKVKVGDRLDGGQIAAIGRDELRYVKGGRNITLTVPSG